MEGGLSSPSPFFPSRASEAPSSSINQLPLPSKNVESLPFPSPSFSLSPSLESADFSDARSFTTFDKGAEEPRRVPPPFRPKESESGPFPLFPLHKAFLAISFLFLQAEGDGAGPLFKRERDVISSSPPPPYLALSPRCRPRS